MPVQDRWLGRSGAVVRRAWRSRIRATTPATWIATTTAIASTKRGQGLQWRAADERDEQRWAGRQRELWDQTGTRFATTGKRNASERRHHSPCHLLTKRRGEPSRTGMCKGSYGLVSFVMALLRRS